MYKKMCASIPLQVLMALCCGPRGVRFSYYHFHLVYLIVLALIGAAIVMGIEDAVSDPTLSDGTNRVRANYIDALFTTVSAVTMTSLTVWVTETMQTGSQVIIFILMLMGGSVFVAIATPLVRLRNMSRAFAALPQSEIAGGSALHTEYMLRASALKATAVVTVVYWVGVQGFGVVVLLVYFAASPSAAAILAGRNISATWWAFFHIASSFGSCGFVLFGDGMVPFFNHACVLLLLAFQTIFGNTCAPVGLRLLLWTAHRAMPSHAGLRFALDNPQSCTFAIQKPLLTYQMAAWAVFIIGFQFVSLLATDWSDGLSATVGVYHDEVPDAITRVLIAFFQSAVTRSSGLMAAPSIISFTPSAQVVFLVAMAIPASPTYLNLEMPNNDLTAPRPPPPHSTSLGISLVGFTDDEPSAEPTHPSGTVPLVVEIAYELRCLCMTDAATLAAAFLLISYADVNTFSPFNPTTPAWLNQFGVLFELSSAWGTSGYTFNPSPVALSASLSAFSKFVVMYVMLGGRMRGTAEYCDPKWATKNYFATARVTSGEPRRTAPSGWRRGIISNLNARTRMGIVRFGRVHVVAANARRSCSRATSSRTRMQSASTTVSCM